MSNLLRGDAVAGRDSRPVTQVMSLPRFFGTRVIRGDSVGLQPAMPLTAPLTATQVVAEELLVEQEEAMLGTPPDLGELEEAARVQGYNLGFEQGRAAGMAAAAEASAAAVERLSALVAGAHESHATFFRAAERQVVDLALQIAQKVVEREIENIPDLAVNVVRAALEEMDARTAVRVRVNPADEELLRRRWAQVVPPGTAPESIQLQQDERVQSGGAIIETTHGQVDAQLESKLAQLGNALWTFVMDVNSTEEKDGAADA